MVAAACLFGREANLARRIAAAGGADAARRLAAVAALLSDAPAPAYWRRRLGFSGPPLKADVALVGGERASAILGNVIVPFLAALGSLPAPSSALLSLLPPGHDDGLVRHAAFVLFGPDHNPKLYRTALRQQGMLQIFHDFCLNDRSACRDCRLPAAIAGFVAKEPVHSGGRRA